MVAWLVVGWLVGRLVACFFLIGGVLVVEGKRNDLQDCMLFFETTNGN